MEKLGLTWSTHPQGNTQGGTNLFLRSLHVSGSDIELTETRYVMMRLNYDSISHLARVHVVLT
jgi:hypothetical protein